MKFQILGLSFLLCSFVFAENKIELKTDSTPARLSIELGYVQLENADNQKIKGPSGALGISYAINSSIGVQGKLEQAFSQSSGFSSMYSLIEIGVVYAAFGSIRNGRESVLLNNSPVVESIIQSSDTIRLGVFANQYFLNGIDGVLGLAGVGFGAFYDRSFSRTVDFSLGLKYSIASNSKTVIYPLQLIFGIFLKL